MKQRIDSNFQRASMWSSHGETMNAIYKKIDSQKDTVFLIDEPENGLSVRSQYMLINKIKKGIENGCQFILATHSVILMQEFENLFNLEVMDYNTFEDFINSQKNKTWKKVVYEKLSDKNIK